MFLGWGCFISRWASYFRKTRHKSTNTSRTRFGFLKNTESCADLPVKSIRETRVNEPLVNWHSVDGDLALQAVRQTEGFASYASDKAMISLSKMLRELEGLNVLPAATAGLHALLEYHKKHPLPGDRYVAVLTGRKA